MPTYNAKSWWYKVRRDALKDAARDVCPICDGRSVGTARLNRPNESGNYTHGDVLCSASAIWSRLANEQDPSCEPVKPAAEQPLQSVSLGSFKKVGSHV